MLFTIKMKAKEKIHRKYLYYSMLSFVNIGAFLFQLLICIIPFALHFAIPKTANFTLTLTSASLVFPFLFLLTEWLRETAFVVTQNKAAGNHIEKRELFAASVRVFTADIVNLLRKMIWLLVYLCPAVLCFCVQIILLQTGNLYSYPFVVLTGTEILLIVMGLVFYSCSTPICGYMRYCAAVDGDTPLKEILTNGVKISERYLRKILQYHYSMLPWKILSFVPFAGFYSLPYLLVSRQNLFASLTDQNQLEANRIKIYNGKNTPTRIVAEN